MQQDLFVNQDDNDWDLIIEPKRKLLSLHLNDVWHYRDLLFLLVKRDFISFYKQTILGPVWFFVQPILTTVVFTFVFGNLAKISTQGIPHPIFYLTGIICWNYFADCLTKTSTVFKDNVQIFGKVYFPRLIMPLSIVFSGLVKFGVQFCLLIGIFIYYLITTSSLHPNLYILVFPFLILLMAAQGLGLGMLISAMTNKYRDLSFLITFGVTLLMYAAPVAYPMSAAPAKYKALIEYNPMTAIIEFTRYGFLGEGQHAWTQLLYSTVITIIMLLLGMIIFNKVEKNFVDTV